MEITPALAAVIGGACGAAVTSLFAFFTQLIVRRSDERKHLLDLVFKTAVTNWEKDLDCAKDRSSQGYNCSVSPLDLYIIHMMALARISKLNLTQDELLEEWGQITKKTHAAFKTHKEKLGAENEIEE